MWLRACLLLLAGITGGCAARPPHGDSQPLPLAPSSPAPPPAPAPSQAPPDEEMAPTIGWFPIKHQLPAEQRVNTPVPLYFEPPSGADVAQVILRFKPFGATHYRKVPMVRLGEGFAYEIPCHEVTTTGHLRYYIELLDAEGHLLESLGSRKSPLHVGIKTDIEGDPPRHPGKKPPRQCQDSLDAPSHP